MKLEGNSTDQKSVTSGFELHASHTSGYRLYQKHHECGRYVSRFELHASHTGGYRLYQKHQGCGRYVKARWSHLLTHVLSLAITDRLGVPAGRPPPRSPSREASASESQQGGLRLGVPAGRPPTRSPSREASASRAADLGSIPAFAADLFPGRATASGLKLVARWLPSQAPGIIGSALGMVDPVPVYCDGGYVKTLICNFRLSVASLTTVRADSCLRYTDMLVGQ